MMMAFDSSQTPPSRLDDQVVGSVREALRRYLADSGQSAPLREALVALAADARDKAMLPEQLLVILKDLWGGLTEVRAMTDVGEQVRLRQRVVTMCIREYYSA
jgi:hypothetical protein